MTCKKHTDCIQQNTSILSHVHTTRKTTCVARDRCARCGVLITSARSSDTRSIKARAAHQHTHLLLRLSRLGMSTAASVDALRRKSVEITRARAVSQYQTLRATRLLKPAADGHHFQEESILFSKTRAANHDCHTSIHDLPEGSEGSLHRANRRK